jgi:chromate transporter
MNPSPDLPPSAAKEGTASRRSRAFDVFIAFLKLGLTSFGGPVAHLGYFNDEFVRRRRWLDEETFMQIVSLSQLLPGPSSSQVGMIIGLERAGAIGAALAWIAFTLPSAILLTAFALGLARFPGVAASPWVHGLLIAAVAVVALAVSTMYQKLCPDVPRRAVAFLAAAVILLMPGSGFVQLGVITAGALYGAFFVPPSQSRARAIAFAGRKGLAVACALLFVTLLVAFPVVDDRLHGSVLNVFGAFYESGALVFGGGHVVLPLLQARTVPPGWISPSAFLAGYGAAQAVPGPLFSFAAYLGATMHGPVSGLSGAALTLFAIYLPSFLLIAAVLPFWSELTRNARMGAALQGVNAAVVGLLLAALYRPVWVSAVHAPRDAALALLAFSLLSVYKTPPWIVVVFCTAGAQILASLGGIG